MSRRVEGTTLAGYKCDERTCDQNGVYAPVLCVPFKGYPVEVRHPLISFIDRHICMKHWRNVKIDDLLVPHMRKTFQQVADQSGGIPDFRRAYLKRVRCHSADFLAFQQNSGLVPPDDALAKGMIEAPGTH